MKIKSTLYLIALSLSLLSCNTYRTFYKETNNINSATYKKDSRLNLQNTNLSEVLKKLPLFTNINALNLSGFKTKAVDTILKTIKNPLKIKVLILDSCKIKNIPKSINRLSHLKQLSLNNNPNIVLENLFNVLDKNTIEFLNLQNNNIKYLPKNINQLQTLVDLNLSGNTINNSFNHLKKLPHLKSLWLTNNNLDTLPDSLFNLTKLRCLYLEQNNLTSIPNGIVNMKKLWIIHAGHNKFKTLPMAFAKMPALLLLHVNNCEIESIPSCYSTKQCKIAGLILDNNKLTERKKTYWKNEFNSFFLLSL